MNLKSVDYSIKHPYGTVEDVIVKIENFSFPLDFVIVDMSKGEEIPIILGRPFLLTSWCNIDLEKFTLNLKVYDGEITLNELENRKQKEEKENWYQVGMIKTCVGS